MTTIQIKKIDLISELSAAAEHFGSTDWDIYVNADGAVDTRHNTHMNSDWDVLIDLYHMGGYEDENGNYPGDDDYDSAGVAEWIVNETDITLHDIERYNYQTEDFEKIELELI
ncbi:hypothetical protein [Bacterioplanoides sp.]|uniref:hypothetical protein n=1 Tax=Bacterioplanoides sp. TaxID=2066072 RepID=UPI003B5B1813